MKSTDTQYLRNAGILALAALILAGPALVHLAELEPVVIRGWHMYGTVGVGAPYGNFEIRVGDAVVRTIRVREALGLEHIHELQPYPGSGGIRMNFAHPDAFIDAAKPLCEALAADEQLALHGRVALRGGWQTVDLSHERLCPQP